ncbi:hypothetical protein [Candidatus Thiosymbion oneisti]|uniref:hypothetical protein n=1 Tax=Candidatus Thiosymbion oneisti TaxID=589554 RepID=UPI00105D19BF|nr:hypothetical protein [Candidatus Thiosymbion oneisti]
MRNLTLKILVAVAALTWAGSGASQGPIKEFVRQVPIDSLPYAEASEYDASVVPTLLRMLKDPREQDYWSNIVATLGIIGDERAVEPMIAFIERLDEGTLNRSQRRAKTSAMMALGYLVNKSGNRRALDYLITNLTLPVRTEGFLVEQFGATAERELNKYAVMGLALSGNRKAAEALESIRNSPELSDDRAAQEMISEALATNKKIADKGLAEYYRTSQP